ncbi:hypothetical protein BD408DRAFT_430718 [Parasitella parasitica]|nr:hypothetical protein BD408DRAFT_430718 [Parasitella parasitica]
MNTNYKEQLTWYENTVKPYAVTPIAIKTRVWHASATKPYEQPKLARSSENYEKDDSNRTVRNRALKEQEAHNPCVWATNMEADGKGKLSTLLEFDTRSVVDKEPETIPSEEKQPAGVDADHQKSGFMDPVAKLRIRHMKLSNREKIPNGALNSPSRSSVTRAMSEDAFYFDASNEWESETSFPTSADPNPDDSDKTFIVPQQQRIEERLALFHQKAFMANQLDSIYAHLDNENLLIVMPSGPARDMCYLLPATLQHNPFLVTIVIVPSLSSLLAKETNPSFNLEQVQSYFVTRFRNLKRNWWIPTVEFKQTIVQALQKPTVYLMTFDDFSKCTLDIKQLHQNGRITRFVLEDAHCVSQWGTDFHFGYLRAAEKITSIYPNTPITALTAVSNERVLLDIVNNLQLQYGSTRVFKRSILL